MKNKSSIRFKMIDFNGMSTCLGLFHIQMLGNHILYMFIFTFFWNHLRVIWTKLYQILLFDTNNLYKIIFFK